MPRNPIAMTGAVRHMWLWLFSSSVDIFYKNPNYNPGAPNKTTIYCVHGTADRNSSFKLISERLKDKLPDNITGIYSVSFNERLTGAAIQNYGHQLKNKILEHQDSNVILMGHSRGSLVVSWFAEFLAKENNITVDKVIAICGPFKGSPLALQPLTSVSMSVSQMQIDATFLRELANKIQQSLATYFYVGAMNDSFIPDDSWFPYGDKPSDENCLLLDRHGHLSILSSHRLIDWLRLKFQVQENRLVIGVS